MRNGFLNRRNMRIYWGFGAFPRIDTGLTLICDGEAVEKGYLAGLLVRAGSVWMAPVETPAGKPKGGRGSRAIDPPQIHKWVRGQKFYLAKGGFWSRLFAGRVEKIKKTRASGLEKRRQG